MTPPADDDALPPTDEVTVDLPPSSLPPDRGMDVPEADAEEQAREVAAGRRYRDVEPDLETPEADAYEQSIEVPLDDDRDGGY